NHGMGAGVTNRKALTGGGGRKLLATSCAIQTGVTDNGGVLGLEVAATGRLDHQLAAGHAFTHVVVGITLQNQVQTTDVPDTEALASGAGQVQGDGGISHALITMASRNFARQACTNRTVTVGHPVAPCATGLLGDG